jgi:hypothetical protein
VFYIETSALDRTNVEAFLNVAADIVGKIQREEVTQVDTTKALMDSPASAASRCCA